MKPDSAALTKRHLSHSRSVFLLSLPPSLSRSLFFLLFHFLFFCFLSPIKGTPKQSKRIDPAFCCRTQWRSVDVTSGIYSNRSERAGERARLTSLIGSCRWRRAEWRNEKILRLRTCFTSFAFYTRFFFFFFPRCPFLRPRAREHTQAHSTV